jgi:putative ABC transport system permease protein
MALLSQIFSISLMNLRNIPARLGSSMVIVVGIGGVVTVLVALLAMAHGFQAAMRGPGHDDRAIVLRAGSNSEINGSITYEQAKIISNKPGIKKSPSGPLMAGESYVSVNINKFGSDSPANVPLRGVDEMSFKVRPEVTIVEGRNIEFGKFEVIVGAGANSQFQGLEIGKTVSLRNMDWMVVGVFDTGGSIYDSEIWADVLKLNSVFGRGSTFSSLTVRLSSNEHFEQLKATLIADPRLTTKIQRESDFYAAQSQTTNQLIVGVGIIVSSIMAIGAIFSVLNTMYTAVSVRSTEIATLRVLGFARIPIVVSVMIESIVLAMIGGSLAGLLTYLFFNGFTVSTIGSNTQVSFEFMVTIKLIVTGVIVALVLGIVGGLFPSVSAARMQITTVLRGR